MIIVDFYIKTRGVGDQKIFAMLLQLGRVHYFKEEFAAYRHVIDSKDSWSSKLARMGEYDRLKELTLWKSEVYRMLEHFFGKIYYRQVPAGQGDRRAGRGGFQG